jgi:hypothetical protein
MRLRQQLHPRHDVRDRLVVRFDGRTRLETRAQRPQRRERQPGLATGRQQAMQPAGVSGRQLPVDLPLHQVQLVRRHVACTITIPPTLINTRGPPESWLARVASTATLYSAPHGHARTPTSSSQSRWRAANRRDFTVFTESQPQPPPRHREVRKVAQDDDVALVAESCRSACRTSRRVSPVSTASATSADASSGSGCVGRLARSVFRHC